MSKQKLYTPEQVFSMIGEEHLKMETVHRGCVESMDVDGFKVYRASLRYGTFYKNLKCVCCGKEGVYFKLDCDRGIDPETTNRRHFNLYAADGTLMTKDHIFPKSLGGKDVLSNMQTMCVDCNVAKGNAWDVDIEGYVGRPLDHTTGGKIYYKSNLKGVVKWHILNAKVLNTKQKPKKIMEKSIELTLKVIQNIEDGTPYFGYIWTKEKFNPSKIKTERE